MHKMLFILILNVLAIFAIYEQYNNVQETTVYIYTYGNKNIESNGTSVRLTNINADGQNLKLKDFFSNDCAEYDDTWDDIIIHPKENEETIFSLNLKPYEKIELTFLKSIDSGKSQKPMRFNTRMVCYLPLTRENSQLLYTRISTFP